MTTQSDDFKWFIDNHDDLYKTYPDKHIVIQGKKVIAVGNSFEEAFDEVLSKNIELGTFIIQECAKGEESYIQSFGSRVVFA